MSLSTRQSPPGICNVVVWFRGGGPDQAGAKRLLHRRRFRLGHSWPATCGSTLQRGKLRQFGQPESGPGL